MPTKQEILVGVICPRGAVKGELQHPQVQPTRRSPPESSRSLRDGSG